MNMLTLEEAYAEHVHVHKTFGIKVMTIEQFSEFWNLFQETK